MTENIKTYTGGKIPFGYKWQNGKIIVDEEIRPYIIKIFERASLGVSFATIAKLLNDKGFKTKDGNDFTRQTIQKMLKNKFYIGILSTTKNGEIKDHEAIIENELFQIVSNKKIISL